MTDMQTESFINEGVHKKRFHLKIFISFIVLSFCFAWLWAPSWYASRIKSSIRNQLSIESVSTVQIGSVKADWHGAVINHLYIEVEDLQITLKNIRLHHEKDLVWKKVSSAVVESMDIKGGAPLTFTRSTKNFFKSVTILPTVKHMKIDNASLVFPEQDIHFTFSGDGERLDESEFSMNLYWKSSSQPDLKATSKLYVTKKMYTHGVKGNNLSLQSAIGTYILPEFSLSQNCFFEKETITYTLQSKIKSPNLSTVYDADASVNVRDVVAEGSLKLLENNTQVALLKGSLNTTFLGEITVDLMPIDVAFFKDALGKYFPNLENMTGKIGANGRIVFKGMEDIDPKLTIKVDKGGFSLGQFTANGLSGSVAIKSFAPLETEQTQELTVAQLKKDSLEIKDVTLLFVCDQGRCLPKNVNGKLFGGVVNLFEFYEAPTKEIQFSGKVRGLALEEMLKLDVFSGVSGNGLLSGEANCEWTDKDITLLQGNFKLTNSQSKLQFSGVNPVTPKMEVLKDLTASILTVRLLPTETATPGIMNAAVYLLGYNPAIQNGYPFEYEIETTGTLLEIIQKSIDKIRSSS